MATGTNNPALVVDNIGNVGIGTTSPGAKLDVNGDIKIAASRYIHSNGRLHIGGGEHLWVLSKHGIIIGKEAGGNGSLLVQGDLTTHGTSCVNGDIRIAASRYIHSDGRLHISGGEHLWVLSKHGIIIGKEAGGNGSLLVQGDLTTHGTSYANLRKGGAIDYAEYFETKNGKEIKTGISIVMDGDKIRPAKKEETPIGIISANPLIVGGVPIEWPKKYLRDEFGKQIMEEYKEEIMKPQKKKIKKELQKMKKKTVKDKVTRTEVVKIEGKYCQKEITETVEREIREPVFKEVDLYDAAGKNRIGKHDIPVMETYEEEIDVLDDNGRPVMVGTGKFETKTRPKINPEYDETKEYIPREQRPEWNCVGLLGQLPLRKGQPTAPTWIKIKDISKDVELWLVK